MITRLDISRRGFLSAGSSAVALSALGEIGFPSSLRAAANGPHIPEAEFLSAFKARLDRLAKLDAFSGTVLIAKDGKVRFAQAYGFADHAFNVPNRIDTKFNLGSMGKMFTAVSILQLVQAGKLSLDDKLIKAVPDYPDQDIAGKITIYQLLTHTSGLGDMFNEKYRESPKEKFNTIEAHLPLFTGKPLLFEPGSKWSYSNAGFIVLGLVIQRVSGESYFDYVRTHVFRPAGMTNTDNFRPHDDVPNMAVGYTQPQMGQPGMGLMLSGGLTSGPRIKNTDFLQPGASAGGGYSTVEDLLKFSQALQGNKLLEARFTDLDMTGKVATSFGTAKYAFGMSDDHVNGVRIVGHSGGGPGINSNLDMYLDLGYVVAVMTNFDNAVSLANQPVRMWLTGQEFPKAVHMSAGELKAFAGTYQLNAPVGPPSGPGPGPGPGPGMKPAPVQISADADGLWLVAGPRHHLLPLGPSEFFDEFAPALRATFTKGNDGKITSLSLATVGSDRPPMTLTRQA